MCVQEPYVQICPTPKLDGISRISGENKQTNRTKDQPCLPKIMFIFSTNLLCKIIVARTKAFRRGLHKSQESCGSHPDCCVWFGLDNKSMLLGKYRGRCCLFKYLVNA